MSPLLDVKFYDKTIFLPLLSTMPPVSLGCGVWPPPVPLFIAFFLLGLDLWCVCAEVLALLLVVVGTTVSTIESAAALVAAAVARKPDESPAFLPVPYRFL